MNVSTDLGTWADQGLPFTATSTNLVYPQYFDLPNWDQLLFRLQAAP